MNTIIKKYKRMAGATAMSLALTASSFMLTGCNDFLDTLPLNDVVLENYWTQKADVTSVLNSCYESLESSESILRMGVWGEMRSDNIVLGRSVGYDIQEILKENILPTNGLTKWDVMYQTINRCNVVCHYAPLVMERDPNYTLNEMKANIAEATFVRDLCYFYLIRTFRDVPISFEPSIDDLADYQIAPTEMNAALDMLIADLEKVKDDAVRRYVDDSRMTNSSAALTAYENSSRVTRVAIYALLADLNLWRGNWDKCIEYCDLVIDFKKEQYRLKKENLGDLRDIYEYDGIPLIRESPDGSTLCGEAYSQIFGDGSSFESLFELYFKTNQRTKNSYVGSYYGTSSQPLGHFAAYTDYFQEATKGYSQLFNKKDCRAYESAQSTNGRYVITKYVCRSVSLDNRNVSDDKSLKLISSRRGDEYANWIVYRFTEVLLMKAEALIMKGEENFPAAFALINTVNKRALNITTSGDKDELKYDDYKQSRETMEDLLLAERNRELMFEGKRWYDLVRVSLRDGSTQRLVSKATVKYKDNVNRIKIKLSDPNIIFFPYNRDELRLNPYLKQNSAYGNTEEFEGI